MTTKNEMLREATYNKKTHELTYWVSKKKQETIKCRTLGCAKLTLLATKHLQNLNQKLAVFSI